MGVFCQELIGCAALVQIGPARQSFWALYERPGARLRERTRLLPRGRALSLEPGRLAIRERGLALELVLEEEPGIEVLLPDRGGGEVWTRKQAGVRAHGRFSLDGAPAREIRARAVIDDTAGHHARVTEWRWSAGVGLGEEGTPLAWNLVSGVNDPLRGSERAVWIDGRPGEAPPVEFARDLSSLRCSDGSLLEFAAEAQRSRHERLLLLSSDYRVAFGTFAGMLPGGVALSHGLGVMEHHRARW